MATVVHGLLICVAAALVGAISANARRRQQDEPHAHPCSPAAATSIARLLMAEALTA